MIKKISTLLLLSTLSIGVMTSCSTGNSALNSNSNDQNKSNNKIVFYSDNHSDKQHTYYFVNTFNKVNFLNAFENSKSYNDYHFYNEETIQNFNDKKLISPYKLTKSIRDYFDFNKSDIDFYEWKFQLDKLKSKTIEFLNLLEKNVNETHSFDKLGRVLGSLYFSKDKDTLALNWMVIDYIEKNYLDRLNITLRSDNTSLKDFENQKSSNQMVKQFLDTYDKYKELLLDLEIDNHTFIFLEEDKSIDTMEYYEIMQKILLIKRLYFEIVYTFDYLEMINQILTNFYDYNLDTDLDKKAAFELSKDQGIFYLLRKQNLPLINFYENWSAKMYRVVSPNYFFGYTLELTKKERLLSVEIEKKVSEVQGDYYPLDFIEWIYNFERNNFRLLFNQMSNDTNASNKTFWEKVFPNKSRKNDLLEAYLKMNLKKGEYNNTYTKFKNQMIKNFSLDYWWEERKET